MKMITSLWYRLDACSNSPWPLWANVSSDVPRFRVLICTFLCSCTFHSGSDLDHKSPLTSICPRRLYGRKRSKARHSRHTRRVRHARFCRGTVGLVCVAETGSLVHIDAARPLTGRGPGTASFDHFQKNEKGWNLAFSIFNF